MALPKLNDVPKYDLVIPSTGQQVRFRPYLVKEEKVLLLSQESTDKNSILGAIVDTVMACVQDDLDPRKLTTFDLEYMFVKIRAKSVGEKIPLNLSCTECSTDNQYEVNLDDVSCNIGKVGTEMIQLTDDIQIEMGYPGYADLDIEEDEADMAMSLIANAMVRVITPEGQFEIADETKQEVYSFLSNLTSEQFQRIAGYLYDMPTVNYISKFICQSCGHENLVAIRGINDFF